MWKFMVVIGMLLWCMKLFYVLVVFVVFRAASNASSRYESYGDLSLMIFGLCSLLYLSGILLFFVVCLNWLNYMCEKLCNMVMFLGILLKCVRIIKVWTTVVSVVGNAVLMLLSVSMLLVELLVMLYEMLFLMWIVVILLVIWVIVVCNVFVGLNFLFVAYMSYVNSMIFGCRIVFFNEMIMSLWMYLMSVCGFKYMCMVMCEVVVVWFCLIFFCNVDLITFNLSCLLFVFVWFVWILVYFFVFCNVLCNVFFWFGLLLFVMFVINFSVVEYVVSFVNFFLITIWFVYFVEDFVLIDFFNDNDMF